jgi:AraC-like DNA-binding protein
MATGGALLQVWRHTAQSADWALILPDGCVDLIGFQVPGGPPRWKLSPLMDRASRVPSPAGQRYAGYRLQPGARVNAAALLSAVKGLALDDTPGVLERLDAVATLDERVSDALQALADECDLRGAQRQLGVSERSLQHLISAATGRPPLYWKRLARWRRAARALASESPLVHIAADHGYADQAHMNLEFRHWIYLSPAQARQRVDVQQLLNETGYA